MIKVRIPGRCELAMAKHKSSTAKMLIREARRLTAIDLAICAMAVVIEPGGL